MAKMWDLDLFSTSMSVLVKFAGQEQIHGLIERPVLTQQQFSAKLVWTRVKGF